MVITRAGIRTMFAKRAFLGLLLISWGPFLFRAITIYASYAASSIPQAGFLKPTPETFRGMLGPGGLEGVLIFLITVYVGSGLIANDRRANALQIYLSKPLTRAEYVFGKLAILMTFLLLVTWLPAIVLLVVQIAFAGNFTFFLNNLFLFPAITVFTLIEAVVGATSMLALSSLSNNSRYVGILYAALIFFSQALFVVLRFVTAGSSVAWISFQANINQIGRLIFRQPPLYDTPWMVSVLAIVVLLSLSA